MKSTPLAHKIRPENLQEFIGQEDLFIRYPFLQKGQVKSVILWGPAGSGKTTLAHILAKQAGIDLYSFNAVLAGVQELRKLIASVQEIKKSLGKESIIFIDEIHRFNRAQQDALLPHIEVGDFILIGATTENPRVSINRPLLSRLQTVELKTLSVLSIEKIIQQALQKLSQTLSSDLITFIAEFSSGDARKALGFVEIALENNVTDILTLKPLLQENSRHYDKNLDRHYDVISAFIKSMRGSDPNAALLWLAIMLEGGEDPVFIARRLVIFASEDIGNADPRALEIALNTLQVVERIGMPEARITLSQATTYLASTIKSNASYKAIEEALEYVRSHPTIDTPDYLKNHPPSGTKSYQYPHNFPEHFVKENYTKEKNLPKFYKPTHQGQEKFLKERLEKLWD
ncbi:MAG: replication-associated recombination protein A [Bacteriovoracaceae bacterium]|nr:replication-associated recombination protein A [Bacteriovoracaceae bacterium]